MMLSSKRPLSLLRLYETSKGFISNQRKLSWSEYSKLTKVCDEKHKRYIELGEKLNQAYQVLESEPNDFIDDEVEDTKTAEVLGTVKLTEIKSNKNIPDVVKQEFIKRANK